MQERQLSDLHTWFTPLTSTIWVTGLGEVGPLPQTLVENLLYYHTKPLALVFDPFARFTNTEKACKRMLRRYYCSDIEGSDSVEKWDFVNDPLPNIPIPDLTYVDFPAMGFTDPEEWSLSIAYFNCLTEKLPPKNPPRFAIHLNSIRMDDGNLNDFLPEFTNYLPDGYRVEGRYVIQYQTPTPLHNRDEAGQSGSCKSCRVEHSDLLILVNSEFIK